MDAWPQVVVANQESSTSSNTVGDYSLAAAADRQSINPTTAADSSFSPTSLPSESTCATVEQALQEPGSKNGHRRLATGFVSTSVNGVPDSADLEKPKIVILRKLSNGPPCVDDFSSKEPKPGIWNHTKTGNGSSGGASAFGEYHWDGGEQNAHSVNENQAVSGDSRSDKTPMCLIASLSRYHSIPHQYKLINESGPAHQKVFTVSLVLGSGNDETEYTAQGASIKKAQQAAAQKALDETKLPKPVQRSNHKRRPTATTCGYSSSENAALTPAVLLNAMTVKLGMKPEYTFLNSPYPAFPNRPTIPPPYHLNPHFRPCRSNVPFPVPPPMPPYNLFRCPPPYPLPQFVPVTSHYVKLKVGDYEFVGHGPNRQLAKHDASAKALRTLEPMVSQLSPTQKEKQLVLSDQNTGGHSLPTGDGAMPEQKNIINETAGERLDGSVENKSPINIVYEYALRRNLAVDFEIVAECGPAHKPKFIVRCVVSGSSVPTMTTEGEGASKKLAKHCASQKMIQQLIIANVPGSVRLQQPRQMPQKFSKEKRLKQTIIKDMKSDPNYGQEINPVCRLIQVQQAKGEAEPTFEFVCEEGHDRCKEFAMKVIIGENVCEGRGPNKKLAKRAAAEAMLAKIGYAKPLPTPGKPVLKHRHSLSMDCSETDIEEPGDQSSKQSNLSSENGVPEDLGVPTPPSEMKSRKVKFQLTDDADAKSKLEDQCDSGDGSLFRSSRYRSRRNRRLAPGLFFMPSAFADCDKEDQGAQNSNSLDGEYPTDPDAKSLYESWNHLPTDGVEEAPAIVDGAKEKLSYLSGLLSFHVQFTDFPKSLRNGEGGEFLSLVSLSTTPPLVCHGSGPSIERAQGEAALAALRSLAAKGLQVAVGTEKTVDLSDLTIDTQRQSTVDNR